MVVILFNRNLTSFSIYDVIQSIWELQFHIQLVSGTVQLPNLIAYSCRSLP